MDHYVHAFSTPLGMPPTKEDRPVCGAVLTDAYDFPEMDRPVCPQCSLIIGTWA